MSYLTSNSNTLRSACIQKAPCSVLLMASAGWLRWLALLLGVGLFGRSAGETPDRSRYAVRWASPDAEHQVQLQFSKLEPGPVNFAQYETFPAWISPKPPAFSAEPESADSRLEVTLGEYRGWSSVKFARINGWLMGPCTAAQVYLAAFFSWLDFLFVQLPDLMLALASAQADLKFSLQCKTTVCSIEWT